MRLLDLVAIGTALVLIFVVGCAGGGAKNVSIERESDDDHDAPPPTDDDALSDDDSTDDDSADDDAVIDDDSTDDDAADDDATDDDAADDDATDDDAAADCDDPTMEYIPGGEMQVEFAGERWGDGVYKEVTEATTINPFCMDRWEASQPDATADSQGSWQPYTPAPAAVSQPGVRPWTNLFWEDADAACQAAGKRLATLAEWQFAFSGPEPHDWPWGDEWNASQGCYVGMTSDDNPTGGCCPAVCGNGACWQVCDLAGNVAEWINEPWQPECFGDEQMDVAGAAAHVPPDQPNSQHRLADRPTCWQFDQYGQYRPGLHHHVRTGAGFADDGFRCVKDVP